jgi:chaperonin GroES
LTWKTPTFAECEPGIEPTEYQVLIAMAEFEGKTPGGIILTASTKEKEQWGATHARLLAVSPLAFTYATWPADARKPTPGDVVFVGKYPGDEVIGRDGKTYRLCSDREISGIIERAKAQAMEKTA